MVMQIVSVAEFQKRLDWLLYGAGMSAREASLKMCGTEGFFSTLLRRDRPPATIPTEKSGEIANFLAGKRGCNESSEVLFAFLIGLENDYNRAVDLTVGNPLLTDLVAA